MKVAVALVAVAGCAMSVFGQLTGPSTNQSSYMVPSDPSSGVQFISIATTQVGEFHRNRDTGVNDYRLVGIPDGMGIYRDADDIANNTFSLLVNHELGQNQGSVRAHGNRGAFVSQWRINRGNLAVQDARDLATTSNLFNLSTNTFQSFNSGSPMPDYVQTAGDVQGWGAVNTNGFGRFCSGDLAPVSAFEWTDASGRTLGTSDRIFLTGEERGPSGRAFAHVVTGNDARGVWELPDMADFSWENSVASPLAQRKTIVAGLDDSGGGELYFYVGDKQASGSTIEKAGLMNGKTYGMVVTGAANEAAFSNVPFTMADLSSSQRGSGEAFEAASGAAGVTSFNRPEDGAWNPSNPNEFIWVTTASVNGTPATRIFSTMFTDITNPELGGMITMLGEGGNANTGTFGGGITSATGAINMEMADNMAVTRFNQVLIQEDVGGVDRLGRLWLYDILSDSLTEVGISDTARFTPGVAGFLTRDEETSGIVDAWDTMGPGWWMINMQAHYNISGELVQGGQLMAVYIPQTVPAPAGAALAGLAGLLISRR